jgi:hypothetical protein
MTLEPWMLRTALVLLVLTGVNVILYCTLRSLERRRVVPHETAALTFVRRETRKAKAA